MSLYLYDQALTEKIKKWTPKSEVEIFSPNDTQSLFRINADKNDDKPIKLPLICIRRNGGYTITNPNKQPLAYDGVTLEATEPKSIQLNGIPISISYQLDIYARKFQEADELMRNFVFNLVNYPRVTVTVPYNNKQLDHDSRLHIRREVQDNSDIPERLVKGQFTRLSISFDIDDAYLWDTRVRDNYTIDVLVEEN